MINRKRPFAVLLLLLAGAVPFLWMNSSTHSILWSISWYSVTALMLIRPLGTLLPRRWRILRFLPYRKELGILSASVVVTNALYMFVPMGASGFFTYYFGDYWSGTIAVILGHLAELVAFPLLLTSNRFSQRLLKKWWKPIQRTTYLYYYGAGVFLFSMGKSDALISMVVVAVPALLVELKNRNLLPANVLWGTSAAEQDA